MFKVQVFRLFWNVGDLVEVDCRLAGSPLELRPLLPFGRFVGLQRAIDLLKGYGLDNDYMLHTLLREILLLMHLLQQMLVARPLIYQLRLGLFWTVVSFIGRRPITTMCLIHSVFGLDSVIMFAGRRLADEVWILGKLHTTASILRIHFNFN